MGKIYQEIICYLSEMLDKYEIQSKSKILHVSDHECMTAYQDYMLKYPHPQSPEMFSISIRIIRAFLQSGRNISDIKAILREYRENRK